MRIYYKYKYIWKSMRIYGNLAKDLQLKSPHQTTLQSGRWGAGKVWYDELHVWHSRCYDRQNLNHRHNYRDIIPVTIIFFTEDEKEQLNSRTSEPNSKGPSLKCKTMKCNLRYLTMITVSLTINGCVSQEANHDVKPLVRLLGEVLMASAAGNKVLQHY